MLQYALMRKQRNFLPDRCYHLVSRVANRAFYFTEEERTRFVERMWRVAQFSCVEVLAYCVMSNHFHILVHVTSPRELAEEEVIARVKVLYSGARLSSVLKEWEAIVKCGVETHRKAFLSRYVRRMWNASEFMKTLKQATSQSFNARLRHEGTMWESRFRARMMKPDEKTELMSAAGYIDRNPVKAGLAKFPDGYRWCSFAAACAGDERAREGYRFIYTFGPVEWEQVREMHEVSIGLALKELEEESGAAHGVGGTGGERLSVSSEKQDAMRRRRWSEIEADIPDRVPRLLPRGSNRVVRDILKMLAERPMRPADLRGELGISSANYFTERYLTPMKAAGLIAQAVAGSPYAPRTEYKITAKGRSVI